MHTAFLLKSAMFATAIDGLPCSREKFLDWGERDRLGVLIDEPFGALGAGLLIQLAITAYFDAPDRKRRMRPNYPDIFLFHVGGRWGNHSALDFWPDHKEIFVPADPLEVLRVINNRAITHLVVPEKSRQRVVHRYKEPEAAHDRIKRCFVYSPQGMAERANASIATKAAQPIDNYEAVVNPEAASLNADARTSNVVTAIVKASPPEEIALAAEVYRARSEEVPASHPSRARIAERIAAARRDGRLMEQFRCAPLDEVLEMLV